MSDDESERQADRIAECAQWTALALEAAEEAGLTIVAAYLEQARVLMPR